jgi:hypothetical protein
MRIQSGLLETIDKQFRLEKDNDFELRLWIFPKATDDATSLSLFILSNKNGAWNGRLFSETWSEDKMKEIVLRNKGFDSLWKNLNNNEVLTIPKAWTLVDRNGDSIIEDADGILYSFELLSKKAVRHYAYKCPKEFSRKYDYILSYKKVAQIVQYIIDFTGIDGNIICTTNDVQPTVLKYVALRIYPDRHTSI